MKTFKKFVSEAKDTYCSDKCCGADVKAEDCTCPADCPHCNCNAKNEALDEAKEHQAYASLMTLATKLGNKKHRDTRAVQVLAGKINNFTATGNRGMMKDMAKAMKSLDTDSQAEVMKILNKKDPALGKSIVFKMSSVKEEVELEEASYTGTAPKPIRWVVSPVSSGVSNPKKYVNTEVKAKTKLEAMKLGAKEMGMKVLDVKAVPRYPDEAKLVESVKLAEAKGKLVKNMKVKHIHNDRKGTVIKGGDRTGGRVEVEWEDGKTAVVAGKYLETYKEEVEQVDENWATKAMAGKSPLKKKYQAPKDGEPDRAKRMKKKMYGSMMGGLKKEEVELSEEEINNITAQYINENDITLEDLENMSQEQLDEIIGKAIGGAFKVAAKTVVGAGRLAKKAANRMSTSGRADAAEKKASAMEKKNKDRARIKAAQDRLRAAKDAARNRN